MKNWKKYAAIIGVIVLLAIFCLPMYFALKGDFSQKAFMASLFTVLFVAVMCYVILMLFKYLSKKKEEKPETGGIKNIIFDVGQVLVDYDWETYLDSFGFEPAKRERIAKATFQSPVWDERDRGLYEEDVYLKQFQELDPEDAEDIEKVIRGTGGTIHKRPYADTWVKYLKSKGYHLYILSNYASYMIDHTKKELTFRKEMDGEVFSCYVNQLKPEPEIYQTILDKYQLKPEESVFIDDRPENCQGAQGQGIHTICFKDFKQVTADLEKLGVK